MTSQKLKEICPLLTALMKKAEVPYDANCGYGSILLHLMMGLVQ